MPKGIRESEALVSSKPSVGKTKPWPSKPESIPLGKRANVMLIEHARVLQKDGRVLYLAKSAAELNGKLDDEDLLEKDLIERYFNIPQHNTALLLLGNGTSITDSAARLLAEANVMVGFVGGGGSPLGLAAEPMFLAPQSEYRPTEYMQAWMRMWLDETMRLNVARKFLQERMELCIDQWDRNTDLQARSIRVDESEISRFERAIKEAANTETLLSAEGVWVKSLYAQLAKGYKLDEFRRVDQPGQRTSASPMHESVNALLTHGNYIAYGFAAVALHALGISFALPVLHGKTRRGALVFDVADLFKDWTVLPAAFDAASKGVRDQEYRNSIIRLMQPTVIDTAISTIKKCL